MIELEGAVVCVTGAGRGIGRATAAALVARGAHVWIGDIDRDIAETTANEIGARAAHLDVADPASFADFLDTVAADGPIEMLVNNAGIMRMGRFTDLDLAGHHREIAINLGGVVNGMHLAIPRMRAHGHGHVVNVASMAAKVTTPGEATYCATKFAVAAISRAVRAELDDPAVTITTILPTAVRTDLNAGVSLDLIPVADPEDVAAAIVASARHRRHEVTVPRWLAPMGVIEQALPETLLDTVKRTVLGGNPGTFDPAERSAYLDRTT